jgi:FlaA1/EpsC-like NDP-sugar epimerase
VIHAGILNADNGAIHILNMGDPVRVVDLARSLIERQGLRPGHDVQIETIGLRPGEKLSEELVGNGESLAPSAHPQISLVRSASSLSRGRLGEVLEQLWIAIRKGDEAEVVRLFAECNFGFREAAIGIGADGDSR